MSNYIERWFTPWIEKVIVAAELALTTETHPTQPEQLVVHTLYKTIGKVSRIQHDVVHVLIRNTTEGMDDWIGHIWSMRNVRVVKYECNI